MSYERKRPSTAVRHGRQTALGRGAKSPAATIIRHGSYSRMSTTIPRRSSGFCSCATSTGPPIESVQIDACLMALHGRLGAVPRSTLRGAFVVQAAGQTRTPRQPRRPVLRNLSRASRRSLAQCSSLRTTSPTAAPIPDTTSANPVPWRSPPRHSMSPNLSDHVKPFLPAPTRLSSSIGASAHRAESSGCSSRHAFGNGCRPIRTPGRTLGFQDVMRRSSCRNLC